MRNNSSIKFGLGKSHCCLQGTAQRHNFHSQIYSFVYIETKTPYIFNAYILESILYLKVKRWPKYSLIICCFKQNAHFVDRTYTYFPRSEKSNIKVLMCLPLYLLLPPSSFDKYISIWHNDQGHQCAYQDQQPIWHQCYLLPQPMPIANIAIIFEHLSF